MFELDDLKMFAERLRERRLHLGLKQTDIAKACGVSRATASDWEKGTFEPKDKEPLIAILKTNRSWLVEGKGRPEENLLTSLKRRQQEMMDSMIPLISWIQAGVWCDSTLYQNNEDEFTEWYPCPEKHSDNTFALKIRGESMSPDFVDGEIIYVDPEIKEESGSCVVVRQNGDTEATFKQLVLDGDKKYLKALNPNWPNPIIEMLPDAQVCGVVIGSYRKR